MVGLNRQQQSTTTMRNRPVLQESAPPVRTKSITMHSQIKALKRLCKIRSPFKSKSAEIEKPPPLTPEYVLGVAFNYWYARLLLTAVEFQVFTKLDQSPNQGMTAEELRVALGFHPRAVPDFTDALLALGYLQREGNGPLAVYRNTVETQTFLVKGSARYIGDILEVCSKRHYRTSVNLTLGLKEQHRAVVDFHQMKLAALRTCKVRLTQERKQHLLICGGAPREMDGSSFPEECITLGFSFWPARVLMTACELGLFAMIAEAEGGRMTSKQIRKALNLRKDRCKVFLETLVTYNILVKESVILNGDPADVKDKSTKSKDKETFYSNTLQADVFLNRSKFDSYVGGIMEMVGKRSYGFWADLGDALTTGMYQNEAKDTGWQTWPELYSRPDRLRNFMEGLIGISVGHFRTFATAFDFSNYTSLVDIGGGVGQLACYVAQAQPHMTCITTDLPPVVPLANKWIAKWNCTDRVTPIASDFLLEDFPKADVITMGMILHDWGLPEKKLLIKKAYDALPPGGALVSLESVIDDERRTHAHGLCMSINMLIEFGSDGGFDFTHADFDAWCLEAGFSRTVLMPLLGPSSAVIAYK